MVVEKQAALVEKQAALVEKEAALAEKAELEAKAAKKIAELEAMVQQLTKKLSAVGASDVRRAANEQALLTSRSQTSERLARPTPAPQFFDVGSRVVLHARGLERHGTVLKREGQRVRLMLEGSGTTWAELKDVVAA